MNSKNNKFSTYKRNKKNARIEKSTLVDTDTIREILKDTYYKNSIEKIDNSDVNINHLENIFTNETYYLAMKIVPLLERKILYLSYIENCKLNDICRKLKLEKKQVIKLRNKGIQHFKLNLDTLYKAEQLKKEINDK